MLARRRPGVGGRGTSLMGQFLGTGNVDVAAVCDIVPSKVANAQKRALSAGQKTAPAGYSAGDHDYENLLKRDGVRLGLRSTHPLKQVRWPMRASSGLGSQPAAPPKEPAFKAGMHVVHPTWGGGIVIETRVMGSDETLTVVFDTVGLKKLAASLANLKISLK